MKLWSDTLSYLHFFIQRIWEGYLMDDFNDFLGFMVTNSGDGNNGDAPGCFSWVIAVGFVLIIVGLLFG